jgi:hypothetical protein
MRAAGEVRGLVLNAYQAERVKEDGFACRSHASLNVPDFFSILLACKTQAGG